MPLTRSSEVQRDELLDRIRRASRVLDHWYREALTLPDPLLGEIEAELLAMEGAISDEVGR